MLSVPVFTKSKEVSQLFDRTGWKYCLPIDKTSLILILGSQSQEIVWSLARSAGTVIVADSNFSQLVTLRRMLSDKEVPNVFFVYIRTLKELPFPVCRFTSIVVQDSVEDSDVHLDYLLNQVWRLLTVDGALYMSHQITQRQPARWLQHRIGDRGFIQVFSYALLPNPQRCKLLVPLCVNQSITRAALRLHSTTTRSAWLKKALFALLARLRVFHWWSPPYIVFAYKQGISCVKLLEQVQRSLGGSIDFIIPVILLPSAGQGSKATIQLLTSTGKPLGYVKIADTETRSHEIRNEANALVTLTGLNLSSGKLPKVLAFEETDDYCFVLLSSLPGHNVPSPTRVIRGVLSFLTELHNKTTVWTTLEQSRFGIQLQNRVDRLDGDEKARLLCCHAFKRVQVEIGQQRIPFVWAHRDFVSWNVRQYRGQLLVVDWEWAAEEHIPYQDLYHFILHGMLNTSGKTLLSLARSTFFKPNNRVTTLVKTYSQRAGFPVHLSYHFFVLYLVDWILIQFALGNHSHLQVQEYVSLLQRVCDSNQFSPRFWLGGLLAKEP